MSDMRSEDKILVAKSLPRVEHFTSLGECILDKLEANLDFVGQIDAITGQQETYGSIRERSVRCALWLKKWGIQTGDAVVLCTFNQLDAVIPCYATLFVGAVFNPFDIGMSSRDMGHVMNITRPKIAFVTEDTAHLMSKAAKDSNLELKIVVFGNVEGFENFSKCLEGATSEEIRDFRCTRIAESNAIAAVLCSSGTTGLPKGVAIGHQAFLRSMYDEDFLGISGKSFMAVTTIYWISGTLCLFLPLSYGSTRIVAPPFEERLTCEVIQNAKPHVIFLSAGMINTLVKFDALRDYDFSSVEHVVTGGGNLCAGAYTTFMDCFTNARLSPVYGMTEVCGIITRPIPGQKIGSNGVVANDVRLKIVDPNTGEIQGANERGELVVKKMIMMESYWGNPKATADLFDSEGWLHTGDIGYYDEDGEIFIVDRIKELIKYQGYHVSPSEIEAVIREHPDVLEVAVLSLAHPTDGEHPMAVVVKAENSKVTEKELVDLVGTTVSERKKLRGGVKFIEKMPLTASGKIARSTLRQLMTSN